MAWIDEQDPRLNPMGVKGIGEIGITGTAAAIGNAVYHATGRRIRGPAHHRGQALRVTGLPVKEEAPCREAAGAAWREPANCQEP